MPRIAPSGSLVVLTWTNEVDGRVYARVSTDGGASWASRGASRDHDAEGRLAVRGVPRGGARHGRRARGVLQRVQDATGPSIDDQWHELGERGHPVDEWRRLGSGRRRKWLDGGCRLRGRDVGGRLDGGPAEHGQGRPLGFGGVLAPKSSYPSFSPVLAVRGTRWMAVFERCASNSCSVSDACVPVEHRRRHDVVVDVEGVTTASRYEMPVGVDVATKTLVMYVDYSSSQQDVYVRQGS